MRRTTLLLAILLSFSAFSPQPAHAGAAEELQEKTRGLQAGTPAEYAEIPAIWKIAVAAGKRNQSEELLSILRVSLPAPGQPLHDWQAVVIGGGVIHGISQAGIWPLPRVNALLQGHQDLLARWQRALELAVAKADDEKVPPGTRYDALRMLAMEPWAKRGDHIVRYLSSSNAELQSGAVSALGDLEDPRATTALLAHWNSLKPANRKLAAEALARNQERRKALRKALEEGKVKESELGVEQVKGLKAEPAK